MMEIGYEKYYDFFGSKPSESSEGRKNDDDDAENAAESESAGGSSSKKRGVVEKNLLVGRRETFETTVFIGKPFSKLSYHQEDDHICVNIKFGAGNPLLEERIEHYEDTMVRDLFCRSCKTCLIKGDNLESYQLPSHMWNAFSECVACEECYPMASWDGYCH